MKLKKPKFQTHKIVRIFSVKYGMIVLEFMNHFFFVIYLNASNTTIGWYKVSQGGLQGTVADPRLIVKKALDVLATSFIMCHNHPSGNLTPSEADKVITKKIKEGAGFLDIKLFDHIILTEESYYSFADEGQL